MDTLQQLILSKIPLRHIKTGWDVCKCKLCNDYKERAGFKFDNNGVVYNCWNCGTTAGFTNGKSISKMMRKILVSFNIDTTDIDNISGLTFFKKNDPEVITLDTLKKINTFTPEISLPDKCFKLGSPGNKDIQLKIVDYLLSRNIEINSYPFYFSLSEHLQNRVIIPIYRNGKLIYWQARSINGSKKRYENSPNLRSSVIFNIDKLYAYTDNILFATEGIFDAILINGIAILGSKLNPEKIELLKASNRRIVFIIDKDKNGGHLAEKVLSLGYEITFSPSGSSDISDSVNRYGLTWTVVNLMKNIPANNNLALLQIKINCK